MAVLEQAPARRAGRPVPAAATGPPAELAPVLAALQRMRAAGPPERRPVRAAPVRLAALLRVRLRARPGRAGSPWAGNWAVSGPVPHDRALHTLPVDSPATAVRPAPERRKDRRPAAALPWQELVAVPAPDQWERPPAAVTGRRLAVQSVALAAPLLAKHLVRRPPMAPARSVLRARWKLALLLRPAPCQLSCLRRLAPCPTRRPCPRPPVPWFARR